MTDAKYTSPRRRRSWAEPYKIKVVEPLKITTRAEREEAIATILHEFCSYTDGCTMSGKKDALVNIGGWLALNDYNLYEEARNLIVIYEGLHTYGLL